MYIKRQSNFGGEKYDQEINEINVTYEELTI